MSDPRNRPRRFRPRAFRLDDRPEATPDFVVEEKPDAYRIEAELLLDPAEQAVEKAQKQGFLDGGVFSWSGLLLSALGGLVSFAFTLWLSNLIESLFARSAALGVIGLGLAALALLAALVLAGREIKSIFRQRHIALLHRELALAHESDDRDLARKKVRELCALYKHDPFAAAAREKLEELRDEIIDGRDLIDIAERQLMPTTGRRGAQGDRRRGQTRVGGGGDQPARHCRCDFRRGPGACGSSGASPKSMAGGPACSAHGGWLARSAPISPSPPAWPWATACCNRSSAMASPRRYPRGWAKACSTAC